MIKKMEWELLIWLQEIDMKENGNYNNFYKIIFNKLIYLFKKTKT
jgi:hypothetical protein